MALPPITPEQRAEALKKASEARKRRAEIKAELKQRKISLSKLIKMADSDEVIGKMRVKTLLESLPRVGAATAAQIMEEFKISPTRRIRGLGPNQRKQLIDRFG